jgi:hypothetical protein
MSKPPAPSPLRTRLAHFARSLTPTGQEQAMIAALLLSMLLGAIVMHYRREYRLTHPIDPSPTPPSSQLPAAG